MGHETTKRIMNNIQSKQLKKQQTDKVLLQAIATSADSEAFLILYNRYAKGLLRYFCRAVDNTEDIFDLSQNFWLHIWQNASQLIYEDYDSVENLFHSIAVKRVTDYYRSATRNREVPLDDFYNLSDKELSSSSPEIDYYSEEIRKITENVLSKYPDMDKQIFVCQKELNYPAQQTASLLNTSTECVYKKVSIITKDLRLQLKTAGYYSLTVCFLLHYMLYM